MTSPNPRPKGHRFSGSWTTCLRSCSLSLARALVMRSSGLGSDLLSTGSLGSFRLLVACPTHHNTAQIWFQSAFKKEGPVLLVTIFIQPPFFGFNLHPAILPGVLPNASPCPPCHPPSSSPWTAPPLRCKKGAWSSRHQAYSTKSTQVQAFLGGSFFEEIISFENGCDNGRLQKTLEF